MNSVKKHIVATGFTLLLAVPVLIFFLQKVSQNKIKNCRSERFKTEFIETIVLPTDKVQWVKAEKEILVEGKYFDVQSYVTEGNQVHFTGFYDHKEDKLVKSFTKLAHQYSGDQNPYTNSAAGYFFFALYDQPLHNELENHWQLIRFLYPIFSEPVPGICMPVNSPPPKI